MYKSNFKVEKYTRYRSRFRCATLFFGCLVSCLLSFLLEVTAQDVTSTLKADSNHIVIGDFLKVKLSVKFPKEFIVVMPSATDSIGNMEVVKNSKIDTDISGNFKTLSQTYTLSAYDSGKYHVGPQKIIFTNKSGIIDSVFTDSVLVAVTTLPVDTTKAFKPIKKPIDIPYTLSEFLPYIIGGIALVAIIVAIVLYIRSRRRKRKPRVVERPKPKDPAHVWARKELKKLEEEKLWQKDEIKRYYSRLTEILRLYLEYRYGWFALESTTEEITDEVSSYGVNDEAKRNLLAILNEADLVKFAKKIPMPDTNVKVMEMAFHFIDMTEQKELKPEEKIHV